MNRFENESYMIYLDDACAKYVVWQPPTILSTPVFHRTWKESYHSPTSRWHLLR